MTAKRTYRTWIAAFVLGLYAFVATPVQVWHQHAYAGDSSEAKTNHQQSIFKSDKQSAEANCQICSHHYSVYAHDTHTIIDIGSNGYDVVKSSSLFTFPKGPFFYTTGRGPPTI